MRASLAEGLEARVARELDAFAVHRALDSIWNVVSAANAYVNRTEPWRLAKAGRTEALRDVLGELYATLEQIGRALEPFLPDTAARQLRALETSQSERLFPK